MLEGEEARWRAELKEREAARMAVLEGEWRRREKAREAEAGALRAEYTALSDKAQQVCGLLLCCIVPVLWCALSL